MKKNYLIIPLFIASLSLYSQSETFPADSLVVSKIWNDKNGENKLLIEVAAVYNPDNQKPSDDGGYPTMIHAKLKNSRYSSDILYNDEDYQMEVIMFYEDAIWQRDIEGVQATFIPFFYCCMDNTPVKVSYIIFYNKKKYLYHLGYLCDELDPKTICTLQESDRDLERKFRKMPKELRGILIDYVETNYNTREDVFPADPENYDFQH